MKILTQSKTNRQLISFFNVNKSLLFIVLLLLGVQCSVKSKELKEKAAIEVVKANMEEQETAWNSGDLEKFMQHYWQSDSLRFINKNGINLGWQKTLTNYKKGYNTKEEMGRLEFTNKSIEILGEEIIFVIGKWELRRNDSLGDLGGMYSLLWKKKEEKWVITTDHSS